jgi:P27 family predicted phage terminase small subunit
MPRGRPPKSVEQKQAEGTLRAADKQTPQIHGGRKQPRPSAHLSDEARKRFRVLCRELKAAGILDTADRGMVELAAIEEATIIECEAEISNHGLVVLGAMGGPITNPAVTIRAKSLNHLRQLYAEIGIGPSSRARFQNLGIKGAGPAQTLRGVGGKPTPLRVVNGE